MYYGKGPVPREPRHRSGWKGDYMGWGFFFGQYSAPVDLDLKVYGENPQLCGGYFQSGQISSTRPRGRLPPPPLFCLI